MRINIAIALGLLCLVLTPITTRADAQQDQNACMMDAQTICGQFIPDRVRVAHCLMRNRRHVSAACRGALKHFR